MNRRATLTAAAATTALGLILAGCATTPERPTSAATEGTVTPAPYDSGPDTVTDYPAEPSYVELSLGETYTYDDGVTVTMSQVSTGTATGDIPGITDQLPAGTVYPVIETTVTNGTTEPISPNPFGMGITYGETGTSGSTLYDEQSTGGIANTNMILPGASQTNRIGVQVPANGSFTIQFSPTYDHNPIFYTQK